jgi:hypothetical protein
MPSRFADAGLMVMNAPDVLVSSLIQFAAPQPSAGRHTRQRDFSAQRRCPEGARVVIKHHKIKLPSDVAVSRQRGSQNEHARLAQVISS